MFFFSITLLILFALSFLILFETRINFCHISFYCLIYLEEAYNDIKKKVYVAFGWPVPENLNQELYEHDVDTLSPFDDELEINFSLVVTMTGANTNVHLRRRRKLLRYRTIRRLILLSIQISLIRLWIKRHPKLAFLKMVTESFLIMCSVFVTGCLLIIVAVMFFVIGKDLLDTVSGIFTVLKGIFLYFFDV